MIFCNILCFFFTKFCVIFAKLHYRSKKSQQEQSATEDVTHADISQASMQSNLQNDDSAGLACLDLSVTNSAIESKTANEATHYTDPSITDRWNTIDFYRT